MENITNNILDNIQQQNYEIIKQNDKIIKHLESIHAFTNFIMFTIGIYIVITIILVITKFEIIYNILSSIF